MAGERRPGGGNTDEGGMQECPTGSSSRTEERCGRRGIFEFMRASQAYISPLSKKKMDGESRDAREVVRRYHESSLEIV